MKQSDIDGEVFRIWKEAGLYGKQRAADGQIFSCVFPAPNASGELHLGHVLNLMIQDTLCRWHRQHGKQVLWSGAIDHGGFSTQTVVEREMAARGLKATVAENMEVRAAVDAWIRTTAPMIRDQIRSFGVVIDLEEERVISDLREENFIAGYFIELYEKGLVQEYDGVVDWCSACRTAVEVIDVHSRKDWIHLFEIEFRSVDPSGKSVIVTTDSPETLPTDVALIASAHDPRYQNCVGKEFLSPFGDHLILYGSEELPENAENGIARVTPAHCKLSFKFARKFGFQVRRAYDESGLATNGTCDGAERSQLRLQTLDLLKNRRALISERVEPRFRKVCRKCSSPIEELQTRQWFLSLEPTLSSALDVLEKGELRIYPEQYEKYCKTLLEQCLKAHRIQSLGKLSDDWCLSAQLECGSRIPAFRCACGQMVVSLNPGRCESCGDKLQQVKDVLSLKFSDALWVFCANRTYTDDREMLHRIAAQAVTVTGLDLLFFWILPITILGTQLKDPTPISTVLIHPLICDTEGHKMSKSIGNAIVPRDILNRFGADCLRLTILEDLDLSKEKMEFQEQRLIANKELLDSLLRSCTTLTDVTDASALGPSPEFEIVADAARNIERALEAFDFSVVRTDVTRIVNILDKRARENAGALCGRFLRSCLFLLHPFLPVTTEHVWQTHFSARGPLAAQFELEVPPPPQSASER